MLARWIGFAVALAAAGLHAAPDTPVPEDLEDWRAWVLHGKEYRLCPFRFDSTASAEDEFICAWPGELELTVTAEGGRFAQDWSVSGGSQWLALPGDGEFWPQRVTANGRPVEIALQQGSPAVRVGAGRHRIAGGFVWDERPATLAVPVGSGILALTVDGERIRLPKIGEQGVWLGDAELETAVQDSLVVEVYRRIVDEIPTRLDTVIKLQISGGVREERLQPVLPSAFVPLSLTSELPAQVQPDGSLRLQARPGDWQVLLTARADTVVAGVALPAPESNMPADEIWSFQAVPRLRAAIPEAARPVDPTQVGAAWTDLPTFRIGVGESLAIVERRRGLSETRNEVHLDRRLWLDFDAGGFVFADHIGGTMRTEWRLDMAAPFALLSATEYGEEAQVTASENGSGLEVRRAMLDVDALGRVETRGDLPVTGWQTDLASAEATLNLPPGHKLLAAIGVDSAPASWTGRWRLLDFFVLLIVTVAVVRLFGRTAGAVALVALVLSFHEPGAPVWTWLNLLAAAALARVAPAGRLTRLARGYRLASFVVLLAWLVPFAIGQIRIAVYPQLEPASHREAQTVGLFEMLSGEMRATSPFGAVERVGEAVVDSPEPAMVVSSAHARVMADTDVSYRRYPDDALMQVGVGKPDWRWTPYRLSWSGPVDTERSMRLAILPSWAVSVLRFLAVGALAIFAAVFAFDFFARQLPDWRQWRRVLRAGSVSGAVFLATVNPDGFGTAHADTPAPEILAELERRLLEPPPCAPRCAEIAEARVRIAEAELSMDLEIHAAASVAVPLPGSADGWQPAAVTDRESNTLPAIRDKDGVLWVRLEAGVHALTVAGPLPPGGTLEIPFTLSPRAIVAESTHWLVAGIDNRALVARSLNLTRLRRDADVDRESWEASRLPVFVAVERTLSLQLDWQIHTVVRRIAPETGALNIVLPLIDGESVISERSLTENGIVVSMSPTEVRTAWQSTLPRAPGLTLRSPRDQPWQEVWRVRAGPMWAVDYEGVPENSYRYGSADRIAEFHPRPGETLTLSIARPEAVGGRTLAFDNVVARTDVGASLRHTTLTVGYRSTRGGTHRLGLPADAQLRTVTVDGEAQQLAMSDGQLDLPIVPGEHSIALDWDQPGPATVRVAAPIIDLGAPASNILVGLDMPDSRWLLFATGPTLGPAILYWSELLALIAAALLLGRFKATPLRWWHWLLLGIGFSTFSWGALAVVAIWLLAFGTRASWSAGWSRRAYNLSQIGFATLTAVAFSAILIGIPSGLLGNPDMHVTGFESEGHRLTWFADQTETTTPGAAVWSLPTWTYKALILAWALWLSFALVRWLPWVWSCFAARGLWLAKPTDDADTADAAA